MPSTVTVNTEPVAGFAQAMREAPDVLLVELTKAFQSIADYDTAVNRADMEKRLRQSGRSGGTRTANVLKSVATAPGRAKSISQLFITEFSRWPATGIFQTGGAISGEPMLTVLTDEGRAMLGDVGAVANLRSLLASGKARLVRTPRGVLIVLNSEVTKTGRPKHGAHDVILAVLRKQVTEKKRLEFYENFDRNDAIHTELLEYAVENTLAHIAASKQQG